MASFFESTSQAWGLHQVQSNTQKVAREPKVLVATLKPLAGVGADDGAGVGSVGGGPRVRLPDVHLRAACAEFANRRAVSGVPPDGIGLAWARAVSKKDTRELQFL